MRRGLAESGARGGGRGSVGRPGGRCGRARVADAGKVDAGQHSACSMLLGGNAGGGEGKFAGHLLWGFTFFSELLQK